MITINKKQLEILLDRPLIFPIAMWLLSRLLILVAMLLIAPILSEPSGGIIPTVGWEVFGGWDGERYRGIAIDGYEYINDGKQHNVAFFPLFPLFIRAFMILGLSVEAAGTLVNNLAFLGAVIVVYIWVEEHHGKSAARWASAVLAWFPLSLFGTVIYSEGVFLLFSTAALRAFDKKQYFWLTLWGSFATAARPTGMALIPATELNRLWYRLAGDRLWFAA